MKFAGVLPHFFDEVWFHTRAGQSEVLGVRLNRATPTALPRVEKSTLNLCPLAANSRNLQIFAAGGFTNIPVVNGNEMTPDACFGVLPRFKASPPALGNARVLDQLI